MPKSEMVIFNQVQQKLYFCFTALGIESDEPAENPCKPAENPCGINNTNGFQTNLTEREKGLST